MDLVEFFSTETERACPQPATADALGKDDNVGMHASTAHALVAKDAPTIIGTGPLRQFPTTISSNNVNSTASITQKNSTATSSSLPITAVEDAPPPYFPPGGDMFGGGGGMYHAGSKMAEGEDAARVGNKLGALKVSEGNE